METEDSISAEEVFNAVVKKDVDLYKKLSEFANLAESYSKGECQRDIVEEYLRLSNCQEILELIRDISNIQSKNIAVLFNVLKNILMRTANDLKSFSQVGLSISSEVMNYGLKSVIIFIQLKQKPARIKTVLQLLSAMIAQGLATAQDVFTKINISHPHFKSLLHKSNPKDEEDIRASFINVIILFLKIGDNNLIRQMVNIKGFLNAIFPGLLYDRAPVILLILDTFFSTIVESQAIGKTNKIRLFNDFTLKYVLKLFAWKGPLYQKQSLKRKLGEDDELRPMETSEEDIVSVRECAYKFLVALCCSYKNGIIFRDFSFGASEKNLNHVITNLLMSFPSPYANTHMTKFIVSVLKTCPDQLKFYLPSLKDNLIPRISLTWLQALSMLKEIIVAQDCVTHVFKSGEKKTAFKLLEIAKNLCMPDVVSATQIMETISGGDLFLSFYLLDYFLCVLNQAHQLIKYCDHPDAVSLYSASELKEFQQLFISSILKDFHASQLLLNYWYCLVSTEITYGDAVMSIAEFPKPSLSEQLFKVLEMIEICLNISPDSFLKEKCSFTTMLSSLRQKELKLTDVELHKLQLKIINFICTHEVKESITQLEVEDATSPLFVAVYVYLESNDIYIIKKAAAIIYSILASSGLFYGCEWEINIWIKEMKRFQADCHHTLVTFWSNALKVLFKNKKDCKNERNTDHAFSSLLELTFIQIRELQGKTKLKTKLVCRSYVETVLMRIMHRQFEPNELLALIDNYKDLLNSKTVSFWESLKKSNHELAFETDLMSIKTCELNISSKIQNAFISFHLNKKSKESSNNFDHLMIEIKNVRDEDYEDIIWQLFFYMNIEASLMSVGALKYTASPFTLMAIQYFFSAEKKRLSAVTLENEDSRIASEPDSSILSDILCYPVIMKYFLDIDALSQDKCSKTFAQSVTDLVFFIVTELQNFKVEKKEKMLNHFKEKAVKSCQINLSAVVKFFDRIIEGFSSLLNSKDIVDMLRALLYLDENALLNVDSKLSYICSLLYLYKEKPDLCILPCELIIRLFSIYLLSKEKKPKRKLRNCIIEILRKYPLYSSAVPTENILCLLEKQSNKDIPLLDLLVSNNPKPVIAIQQSIMTKINKLNEVNKEFMVHTMNKCIEFRDNSESQDIFLQSLKNVYWQYIFELLKYDLNSELKNPFDEKIGHTFSFLVQKNLYSEKKMRKFLLQFLTDESKQCVPCKSKLTVLLQIIKVFVMKTSDTDEFFRNIFGMLFNWLIQALSNVKSEENFIYHELLSYVTEVVAVSKKTFICSVFCDEQKWITFVQHILKVALKNASIGVDLLQLLQNICEKMYTSGDDMQNEVVVNIYGLLTSHTNFFTILLDEKDSYTSVKESLLDLLITLVRANKAVCKSIHVTLFLASYNATLSTIDCKLLYLMKLYEDNGIDMSSFSPFSWGKSAIAQYSVKKHARLLPLNQPRTQEVLKNFQHEKLELTVLNFPLHLTLQSANVPPPSLDLSNIEINLKQIYDPRFVMPLLSVILSPGSFIHCNQFLESSVLSVVFASLSSYDPDMRALGYYCLTEFYNHLESSMYRQKLIWTSLLDCVRNAIGNCNTRLPCIITVFLAKVSSIFIKSDHKLYTALYKFLTVKPTLDISNIPEFYKLFNSIEVEYRLQRSWILSLIREGMRTSLDFHLYQKRYLSTILCPYFTSTLAQEQEMVQILQILAAAVKIYSSARILCQNGLLIWLHGIVNHSKTSEEIFHQICILTENLWKTFAANLNDASSYIEDNMMQKETDDENEYMEDTVKADLNVFSDENSYAKKKSKLTYLSFAYELLLVHVSMLKQFSSFDMSTLHMSLKIHLDILQTFSRSNDDLSFNNLSEVKNLPLSLTFYNILDIFKKFQVLTEKSSPSIENKNEEANCANISVLFCKIIIFWQPVWKQVSGELYSVFNLCLLQILSVVMKYIGLDDHLNEDISKWLFKIISEDERKGIVKLLLSNQDGAKYCLTFILKSCEKLYPDSKWIKIAHILVKEADNNEICDYISEQLTQLKQYINNI